MKSFFITFLLWLLPCLLCAEKRVLVSVAPYVTIVQELAGNEVEVELMVPPGISGHSFEPSPKQIMEASRAALWFCIGESFEPKAVKAITAQNPDFIVVDLRQGLNLTAHEHTGSCNHHYGSYDPHIWMSPQMMQVQVHTMATALCTTFPELEAVVQKNRAIMLEKLQELDVFIKKTLATRKKNVILVAHPAYGYLCEEVGITQQSIEIEGKDPTPQQLMRIIDRARKENIHVIFVQNEYPNKGARLIAEEIDAEIVILNPYDKNYFNSMRTIAQEFAKALE